jgi:Ca-activated chloride channel family protein
MYFRARDAEALQAIYAKLDELEPISRDSQQMRPLRAWFYYPLGLALLLSVLMALWPLMNTWLNSKNQVKT